MIKTQCDMCGAKGNLYKATIEGAELTVCLECSKFGTNVAPIVTQTEKKAKDTIKTPEVIESIVPDFASIIHKKRESINLTQKEFAKKINEKESLIHQIESGTLKPQLSLARKIERYLRIRLIEKLEENYDKPKHLKIEVFTLGDYIKRK